MTTRSVDCASAPAGSASASGSAAHSAARTRERRADIAASGMRNEWQDVATVARNAPACQPASAPDRPAAGRASRHARLDRLGGREAQVLAEARRDELHADRQCRRRRRSAPPWPGSPSTGTAISVAHSRHDAHRCAAALSTSKPCAYGGLRADGRQHQRRAREEQVPVADAGACARRARAGARRASRSGALSQQRSASRCGCRRRRRARSRPAWKCRNSGIGISNQSSNAAREAGRRRRRRRS